MFSGNQALNPSSGCCNKKFGMPVMNIIENCYFIKTKALSCSGSKMWLLEWGKEGDGERADTTISATAI